MKIMKFGENFTNNDRTKENAQNATFTKDQEHKKEDKFNAQWLYFIIFIILWVLSFEKCIWIFRTWSRAHVCWSCRSWNAARWINTPIGVVRSRSAWLGAAWHCILAAVGTKALQAGPPPSMSAERASCKRLSASATWPRSEMRAHLRWKWS